jgi:uncharacterized RDD family membrane protein YckC
MTDIFHEENFGLMVAQKRLRVYAALIDYAIFCGFFIFIAVCFGEKYTTVKGGVGYHLVGLQPLICIIFWFVTIPLVESFKGQTLGKYLFKIKVTAFDFSEISFFQALIRHLLDFVDWFPFFGIVGLLVASNNNMNQRVGDLAAKTVVVSNQN